MGGVHGSVQAGAAAGQTSLHRSFPHIFGKFWLNLGVIFVHFSNLHFWLKSLEGPRGAGLKTVEGGVLRRRCQVYC